MVARDLLLTRSRALLWRRPPCFVVPNPPLALRRPTPFFVMIVSFVGNTLYEPHGATVFGKRAPRSQPEHAIRSHGRTAGDPRARRAPSCTRPCRARDRKERDFGGACGSPNGRPPGASGKVIDVHACGHRRACEEGLRPPCGRSRSSEHYSLLLYLSFASQSRRRRFSPTAPHRRQLGR